MCSYLRDTAKIFSTSIRLFSTSVTCPFSGPCFTFSLPIRYTDFGVKIRSLLIPWSHREEQRNVNQFSCSRTRMRTDATNLETTVIFGDFLCKVDLFSLAQELPELRSVIHTQVVSYKVSVQTVSPPLLPVQQQVRGCIRDTESETGTHTQTQ